MKEDRNSLGKIRGYSYLVFVFELVMLVHAGLSKLIGMNDTKLVYGLVLLIFVQLLLCMLWNFKYVMSIQGNKNKKEPTMYAARIRIYLIFDFFWLAMIIVNQTWFTNYFIDKMSILGLIMMLIGVLKNCTILQRHNY